MRFRIIGGKLLENVWIVSPGRRIMKRSFLKGRWKLCCS